MPDFVWKKLVRHRYTQGGGGKTSLPRVLLLARSHFFSKRFAIGHWNLEIIDGSA